jgi:hypothetical protein
MYCPLKTEHQNRCHRCLTRSLIPPILTCRVVADCRRLYVLLAALG